MPTKSIAVRLPEELYNYLVARAEKEHRTLSNMIIYILLTTQLVRCKDCKYYNDGGVDCNGKPSDGFCLKRFHSNKGDNWFCADGEKR